MGWRNGETDRRDRGHIKVCGRGPVDTTGPRTGMTCVHPDRRPPPARITPRLIGSSRFSQALETIKRGRRVASMSSRRRRSRRVQGFGSVPAEQMLGVSGSPGEASASGRDRLPGSNRCLMTIKSSSAGSSLPLELAHESNLSLSSSSCQILFT